MFRFTIRDLLWLTALVAMGLTWWIHYRQYAFWDHQGALLDIQLRALGWRVTYSDDALPQLTPPPPSGH